MGPCSLHSTLIIRSNLPSNCLFYVQLKIVLLDSQEHKGNDAAWQLIYSLFKKLSTLLFMLVHPCATEMSVAHVGRLTKFSLSKRTNGADLLRFAKYCSSKTFSTSVLRSAELLVGSRPWSSSLNLTSRLKWSYLVNTAITGTRIHISCWSSVHKVVFGHTMTTLIR